MQIQHGAGLATPSRTGPSPLPGSGPPSKRAWPGAQHNFVCVHTVRVVLVALAPRSAYWQPAVLERRLWFAGMHASATLRAIAVQLVRVAPHHHQALLHRGRHCTHCLATPLAPMTSSASAADVTPVRPCARQTACHLGCSSDGTIDSARAVSYLSNCQPPLGRDVLCSGNLLGRAVHSHLPFDENAGYRIRYPYIKSPYKIIMFSVFSVTGIV